MKGAGPTPGSSGCQQISLRAGSVCRDRDGEDSSPRTNARAGSRGDAGVSFGWASRDGLETAPILMLGPMYARPRWKECALRHNRLSPSFAVLAR